tara:strand:+ start:1012 stop:1251 length:240 start_codon:yes stop_codon:yes gene_type:complete
MDLEDFENQRINKIIEKLTGNKDPVISELLKASLKYDKMTPEIISVIEKLRIENEKTKKMIDEQFEMTLDNEGKIIPIK